jgi:Na+-translocating ferredoxin:NAD+ oxidoreductase RnfC subunit
MEPVARPEREIRKIPTNRLAARLGLSKYYGKHLLTDEPIVLTPETVEIPLKQHIGAPSTACVAVGDKVCKGDVIGQMDEGKLGANVYASFDGEVVAVTDRVVIRRESK